jgi:hypothetical protein
MQDTLCETILVQRGTNRLPSTFRDSFARKPLWEDGLGMNLVY